MKKLSVLLLAIVLAFSSPISVLAEWDDKVAEDTEVVEEAVIEQSEEAPDPVPPAPEPAPDPTPAPDPSEPVYLGPQPGTYQDVMACDIAKYIITCQPNDAVPLNVETTLESSDLGKCESGIYFNLPRLKNAYYYAISQETEKWKMSKSIYPSIYLPQGVTSEENYKLSLDVVHVDSDKSVARVNVTIVPQLTGTTRGDYRPELNHLYILALETETTYYNPEYHKYGAICPNASYIWDLVPGTSSDGVWLNTTLQCFSAAGRPMYTTIDSGVSDIAQFQKTGGIKRAETAYITPGNPVLSNTTFRLKPYAMSTEGSLIYSSTNRFDFTECTIPSGSGRGEYYIAGDDCLIIGCNTEEYETPVPVTPVPKILQSNKYYTYNELTDGYLVLLPFESVECLTYYEKLNKYFVSQPSEPFEGYAYTTALRQSTKLFQYTISGDAVELPPTEIEPTTYTLRYTYTTGLSSSYIEVTPGVAPTLGTPTKSGYRFLGWYVDEALTKEYSEPDFAYVLGATYNLYPKWEVIGTYTVRFYDDKNGTDTTLEFATDTQPVLPKNPTYTGYLFSNWLIVNTVAATNGTPYDPDEFTPVKDKNYIFKANWDVQGIILSVTSNKKEYWVGEKIDVKELVVVAQVDNNGTTRNLATDEFKINPATVNKSGDNVITVTYTATGATNTVVIQGKSDYVTGISASWTGGDMFVGDAIPTSKIVVKLTYKSGKTVTEKTFGISPSVIRSIGSNTITVTASSYSTSITINGKRKDDTSSGSGGTNGTSKLSSIIATYTGDQLYVGDNIKASDLKVTARYADGTNVVLNSGDFNYSPSFIKEAGTNPITISYQDKTTVVNIAGFEKNDFSDSSETSEETGSSSGNKGNTNRDTDDGTTNKGNTSTGSNKGSTSKDDKGTSPGYLNGKNILDSNGKGMQAAVEVNDVDILSEIQEAGDGASGIHLALINTAEGNYLTRPMVEALIKKGIVLTVTMLNPNDRVSEVGVWQFNGKAMKEMDSVVDLNLSFSKIPKASEKMFAISLCPADYSSGVTLTAIMKDAYPQGTFINMYSSDEEYASSEYLSNFLWDSSNSVTIPLDKGYNFCLSDGVITYANYSDLTKELDEYEIESPADISTPDDEYGGNDADTDGDEEPFDWGTDDGDATESSQSILAMLRSKLPIVIAIVVVLGLLAVGATLLLLKSAKGRNESEDFDDYADGEYADDADENIDDEDLLGDYEGFINEDLDD